MKSKINGIKNKKEIPFDDKKSKIFVSEDEYVNCENTMEIDEINLIGGNKALFDFGASGGAISPNTEVNSENQGVTSEIPKKPDFTPGK